MISPSPNVHVWLACGRTDMRRGFDGLSSQVQQQLSRDPFSGELFVFRGRRPVCRRNPPSSIIWGSEGRFTAPRCPTPTKPATGGSMPSLRSG